MEFKNLFKKTGCDNKNSIKIGVIAQTCDECQKYNAAIQIYEMFSQRHRGLLLKYDRDNETFLLNEAMLMRIIQTVNPA